MTCIDSHAHFDLCVEEGMPEDALLSGMEAAGVRYAVQVSIDPAGFAFSREFARRNRERGAYFTLGIHPSTAADEGALGMLEGEVVSVMGSDDAPLLFGIGEAGLDYYRLRRPREEQARAFEFQAALATRLGLPLIVHSRDALDDTLALLARVRPAKGVMHCFSGDSRAARRVLDLGFMISFAGNLTYKAALDLQDAACFVPLDRVLLETDAPFLTPVPLRGRKNRPEHVAHTYAYFASLRGEPVEMIAESVEANFFSLLGR
ncbi:MAG: TatD family deoxyribonuclease [Spirochaetes bacterium]|nr:MAG: TatD family deoxyribonuclease [Spirochaetota bacterium]